MTTTFTASGRLSLAPAPVTGESLPSWLSRTAETYGGMNRNPLMDTLGLPENMARVLYGQRLEPAEMSRLSATTGLSTGEITPMLLAHYGHGLSVRSWTWQCDRPYVENSDEWTGLWWWRMTSSAVCPQCLEHPASAWKTQWRLLPVVACEQHEIFLHNRCPSCHGRFLIANHPDYRRFCPGPQRGQPKAPAWRQNMWAAPQLHRPGGCGLPLASLPRFPVTDPRVLSLQREVLDRITRPAPHTDEDRAYMDDLYVALRLAIQLGRQAMLDYRTDPVVWGAFGRFQQARDQVAACAGRDAELAYRGLAETKPGPMLMAAAISIVADQDDTLPEDPTDTTRHLVAPYSGFGGHDQRIWTALASGTSVFARWLAQQRIVAYHDALSRRWNVRGELEEFPEHLHQWRHCMTALGEWSFSVTSPDHEEVLSNNDTQGLVWRSLDTFDRDPDQSHRCQPFTGPTDDGEVFPVEFQTDPWCWSPQRGFHRASNPDDRIFLRVDHWTASQLVGCTVITPQQAVRLGCGLGTALSVGVSAVVYKFCQISAWVDFFSAEPFAEFGHALQGYDLPRARGQMPMYHNASRRAVFQRAYRLMDLSEGILGPWKTVLEPLSWGEPLSDNDLKWIEQRVADSADWRRRLVDPQGWRDHLAGCAFDAMYYGDGRSDSAAMARLFALAQPDETQASEWLMGIAEAVRQHGNR